MRVDTEAESEADEVDEKAGALIKSRDDHLAGGEQDILGSSLPFWGLVGKW